MGDSKKSLEGTPNSYNNEMDLWFIKSSFPHQVSDARTVRKRTRIVICQKWPYACLNLSKLENISPTPQPRKEDDLRMREVEEAISRSRELLEQKLHQMPVKALNTSPARRLKAAKKQPRTLLNSAVRI